MVKSIKELTVSAPIGFINDAVDDQVVMLIKISICQYIVAALVHSVLEIRWMVITTKNQATIFIKDIVK